VQFKHHRHIIYLGQFDIEDDAARAYDRIMVQFELHGVVRNMSGGGVHDASSAKDSLNFAYDEYEGEFDELRRMTQNDLVQKLRQQGKHKCKRKRRESTADTHLALVGGSGGGGGGGGGGAGPGAGGKDGGGGGGGAPGGAGGGGRIGRRDGLRRSSGNVRAGGNISVRGGSGGGRRGFRGDGGSSQRHGVEVVGASLRIFWHHYGRFYPGVVRSFHAPSGTHHVVRRPSIRRPKGIVGVSVLMPTCVNSMIFG
jgi:hypothetical protein